MAPVKKIISASSLKLAGDIPEEYRGLSLDELQLVIAQADLQTRLLDLDRIKDENGKRIANREALEKYNRQIQMDIASQEAGLKWAQDHCRHKMGGRHQDVYSGDSHRSTITRTQMLDGYTYLLLCTRCRLKVYTPHPTLKKTDPERYAKEKAIYDPLLQMSKDTGLDEIRGPSFIFERDGVPFIPVRS